MTAKIKTFVDANVLIAAWRGDFPYSTVAAQIVSDGGRDYVASMYVKMETQAKAEFFNNRDEATFYQTYFDNVAFWVEATAKLADEAYEVARIFGLRALDALHVAAALSVGADEFVTAERATSPLSRVRGVQIVSIK